MQIKKFFSPKRRLTDSITLPDAENNSPEISISTLVSAPTAGWETQARKWRTTSSYNLCHRVKEKLKSWISSHTMKYSSKYAVNSKMPIMIVALLTWWSWLNRFSPDKSFVGWMGGWALSSCPPLPGFLQSPAPGSSNCCAYDPHMGCLCCSCTIAYMKLMSQWSFFMN